MLKTICLGLLGCIFCAAGIGGGLYIGGYLMLINGLIQLIHACQATPLDSVNFAWGLAKIILSSGTGYLIATIGIGIGGSCFAAAE